MICSLIFDDPNALIIAGEKKDGVGEKKEIKKNKSEIDER
jgi:hypothetical protein